MAKEVVRNINININGKEVVNSLAGITKGLRETNRDLKNLNKSDADYTDQLKKHNDRISELKTRQKDFIQEIYGTSKALKTTTKEVEAGTFSFQNFMGSLMSGDVQGLHDEFQLLSNGIGNVTKQSLAFIATPIGAAITALTGIVLVTKYWYDYNTEMSKATQLLQQFTGLTGTELEIVTVKTKSFASIAEEDLKVVANSVNAVAKAYNINYLEALELVEKGYVRGGKAADDFFDNTAEYVTHFENAGFTAKEFFSVLEEGAKSGTYKDKLVDTIKELDLRLKEMTKSATDALNAAFGESFTNSLSAGIKKGSITTKEALQLISIEADKVGLNFQQKQTLVADVFGSMGEDAGGFAKVVEAINSGLEKTERQLTDVEKSQLLVIRATEELDNQMSNLFNNSGAGFETLIANSKVFALNWLAKIIRGFNNLITLGGAFNNSIAIIFFTIKETAKALMGFTEVGSKAFELDFSGAVDSFKKHFENVGKTITTGKDMVKKIMNNAGKEISSNYYTGSINGWGGDDFMTDNNESNSQNKNSNKNNSKSDAKAKREREQQIEAEKKKQEQLKDLFESGEKEINEILNQSQQKRDQLKLNGLQREEQIIKDKYANEISKVQESINSINALDIKNESDQIAKSQALTERLKEIEVARDLEIQAIKDANLVASWQRAEEIESENRILKAEQDAEIEAEKITSFEDRALFMLEKTREIAELELEIEREKQIEKLRIAGASAEEIAAVEQSFTLKKDKIRRDSSKAEEKLKSDQVKWTELTEEQKLNSIKGSLNSAAEAFNEGSGAWKAAKIAETVITTYQSATSAFNSLSGIPIVGPALGAAAAALAVVSGLKNIQKISSTPIQKMPTHFYGGPTGNKSVGMSDEFGAITGGVHANEWVSPAFMTQSPRYAPIINWLENERQMSLNGNSSSNSNPFFDSSVMTILTGAVTQLSEVLANGIQAKAKFGYEEIEKFEKLQKELKNTKQNAIIS